MIVNNGNNYFGQPTFSKRGNSVAAKEENARKCFRCKEWKPESHFCKNSSRKDGLSKHVEQILFRRSTTLCNVV